MLDAFSTETIAGIAVTISAFLGRMLLLLWRFSRSPEGRVIRRVFREAGMKAALKARSAFAEGLAKARAEDSEGGAEVTPHERHLLAKETAQAFRRELDVLGVLTRVAEAFGGVEALEEQMARRIEDRLNAPKK